MVCSVFIHGCLHGYEQLLWRPSSPNDEDGGGKSCISRKTTQTNKQTNNNNTAELLDAVTSNEYVLSTL